ncbi:hypothetical protein ESCO47_00086 [Escherichia phage vB_EcoM_ESCO47]|nr:hypothetical protein ESCO47_00086 [Escherichia phage vB_EcoM_ESCO47]
MLIKDKEIKVDWYYSVNGYPVQVTKVTDQDVWYRPLKRPDSPLMVCNHSVFCSVAKEIKS